MTKELRSIQVHDLPAGFHAYLTGFPALAYDLLEESRRGVPRLQIHGLGLAALAGSEPEIQIRNARVRM